MTFSIPYDGREEGDDAYAQYSVDWNWKIRGEWARSDQQGPGTAWWAYKGLDERAYSALLDAFGLTKDQAPLEKIITMSPKQLSEMGTRNPESYTLGDHRKASEVNYF
jgi:hypothetical protein